MAYHPQPTVEGPRGYKMPEALARSIENVAKDAGVKPDTYRRLGITPSDLHLEDGSRCDVSTITTDAVDHDREVVLPKGIDLAVFRANPIVPFAHRHDEMPVGKCKWIKSTANGLSAMTEYAAKPKDWSGDWLPDAILSLIQQGMCPGKSIGFLPSAVRMPTLKEISDRPELKNCKAVIEKCTLLEYSVAPVPANPDALAHAVSKGLFGPVIRSKLFGLEEVNIYAGESVETTKSSSVTITSEPILAHCSPETIDAAIRSRAERLKAIFPAFVEKCVRDEFDRACGRL